MPLGLAPSVKAEGVLPRCPTTLSFASSSPSAQSAAGAANGGDTTSLWRRLEQLERVVLAQSDEIAILKKAVALAPLTTAPLAVLLLLTPVLLRALTMTPQTLGADDADVIRLLKHDIDTKLRHTHLDPLELSRYIDAHTTLAILDQVKTYFPRLVVDAPPPTFVALEFFELPIIDQLLVIETFNDPGIGDKLELIQQLFQTTQVPFHYWGFYGVTYLGDLIRLGLEPLPLWPEFLEYLFQYRQFYEEDLHHMHVWLHTRPKRGQPVLQFVSRYKQRAAHYKDFPGKFTLERDRLVFWLKRSFPERVAAVEFEQVVHRDPFYHSVVQMFSANESFN